MKRIATGVLFVLTMFGLVAACGPRDGKKVKNLNEKQAKRLCKDLQDYGACELDGGFKLSPPDNCDKKAKNISDVPDSCDVTVGDYRNCYDKCSESACKPIFSDDCVKTSSQ